MINMVGQRLRFVASEATAFTYENGEIIRWSPDGAGKCQVFQSKGEGGAKQVLRHDGGRWWRREKKEAENCWYAEAWFGEYPYGSYGYGFRVCKHTGAVHVEGFETEINPRGMTGQDVFWRDCKSYVPAV